MSRPNNPDPTFSANNSAAPSGPGPSDWASAPAGVTMAGCSDALGGFGRRFSRQIQLDDDFQPLPAAHHSANVMDGMSVFFVEQRVRIGAWLTGLSVVFEIALNETEESLDTVRRRFAGWQNLSVARG